LSRARLCARERCGVQTREHLLALVARMLELLQLQLLCRLERRQLALLLRKLAIELIQVLHLRLDPCDLAGACPTEIAVIGEQPAAVQRVLLVEQQFEWLLLPDHVGHAQLAGQPRALSGQALLLLAAGLRQGGTARTAIGIVAVGAAERVARLADRELGGSQVPRQPVALERIAADLLADAVDFLAQRLQLRFGFARGGGLERAGRRRQQREQDCNQSRVT
jgi:hypothetical protein